MAAHEIETTHAVAARVLGPVVDVGTDVLDGCHSVSDGIDGG